MDEVLLEDTISLPTGGLVVSRLECPREAQRDVHVKQSGSRAFFAASMSSTMKRMFHIIVSKQSMRPRLLVRLLRTTQPASYHRDAHPVGTISSWLARTSDRQLNLAPVIPVREACIIGKAIERAC